MAFLSHALSLMLCLMMAVGSTSVMSVNLHSGSQVWRIQSSTRGLQWLQKTEKLLTTEYKVDFWKLPNTTRQPIDVMIPDTFQPKFRYLLKKYNMTYSVMIDDVGALIKQQELQVTERMATANLSDDEFDYENWHTYGEIRQWVRGFAAEWSHIVTEFVAGQSYEGRDIAGVKIARTSENEKRSIWIQGGIHPNNWISQASVMYIANQLIQDFRNGDPTTAQLFDWFDFYIVPLVNVDGYVWTRKFDRLWRKTVSPNLDSVCVGTDANRNYPFHWGGEGAMTDPCDPMYRGDSELSEVEIQSVVDFAMAQKAEQKFKIFLDVQSYGLRWLAPWGYTDTPTVKAEELSELGDMVIAAVNSVHEQTYITGPLAETVSINPGTAADWAFAVLKAPYSFTVELRDDGTYGYLVPIYQIKPTSEETLAGLKVAGLWAIDEMKRKGTWE